MGMQVRLLIEPLITALKRTYKWFLSRMNAHMRLQVEVQGESFVTEMAFVWFFTLIMNRNIRIYREIKTYSVY